MPRREFEGIDYTDTGLMDRSNFVPLMGNIESHVMRTIYTEFNDRFVQWLDALLEDSGITSRLDETFTPQMTQQGFDTPIEFLSGGEKTSCALAYRLALNKVINDVVESIKTKDLLILDEPTDGFSSSNSIRYGTFCMSWAWRRSS